MLYMVGPGLITTVSNHISVRRDDSVVPAALKGDYREHREYPKGEGGIEIVQNR
ncbi:MAG: hypothetical protein PHF24_01865 [Syntrophomonas sp.]|nr:hypothetical protein [Syntrophomonas sp.]